MSIELLQMESVWREDHSVSFPVKFKCPELPGIRFQLLFYLFFNCNYSISLGRYYTFSEENMLMGKNLGIQFSSPDTLEWFFPNDYAL